MYQMCGMEQAEGGHGADNVRFLRAMLDAGVSHNTPLLHPLYFGEQFLENLNMTSLIKESIPDHLSMSLIHL